jgi:hypothetical protein
VRRDEAYTTNCSLSNKLFSGFLKLLTMDTLTAVSGDSLTGGLLVLLRPAGLRADEPPARWRQPRVATRPKVFPDAHPDSMPGQAVDLQTFLSAVILDRNPPICFHQPSPECFRGQPNETTYKNHSCTQPCTEFRLIILSG